MDLDQLPRVCYIQRLHSFIPSQSGDLVKIHLVAKSTLDNITRVTCMKKKMECDVDRILSALMTYFSWFWNENETQFWKLSLGVCLQIYCITFLMLHNCYLGCFFAMWHWLAGWVTSQNILVKWTRQDFRFNDFSLKHQLSGNPSPAQIN